jgi:predicted AlkP superfamily phosphohydrolase/phosphomutase
MKRKTILFGIDGATWNFIDKFMEENVMPTMSYILKHGTRGTLLSTFPPETMAAWTSIFTGVNPGKHGVPDFRLRVNNRIELAGSHYRMVDTIWKIMSQNGLRSIVVNDPVTYPPDPINGIVTTGLMTPPNLNYAYPPELRSEIDSVVGGYSCEPPPDFFEKAMKAKPDAYQMLEEVATKHAKTALHLARNHEWDILAPIFTTTDRLQHVFFSDLEYIRRHYALIDGFLKQFLEIAVNENANLFIVSDHGFGQSNRALYVNTWLTQLGFEKVKKSSIRSLLASSGLTLYKLTELVGKLHLSRAAFKLYRIFPKIITVLPFESYEEGEIDYTASQAYSSAYHGIYLNTALHGQEYEKVRNAIIRQLDELTDDGIKVIEKLYKREEVLWGEYSNRAPDIFVVMREGYGMSTHLNPKVFDRLRNREVIISGSHRAEGIFAAFGPDIRSNMRLHEPVHTWDVAPTILHMHNLPIPEHMDGKALVAMLRDDSELNKSSRLELISERHRIKERIRTIESSQGKTSVPQDRAN